MKKVFLSDSVPETSFAINSFWRWRNEEDLYLEKLKEFISYTLELGINAFEISPIYGTEKLGVLPITGSLIKERIRNAATANEIQLSHADWHFIYDETKKN